MGALRVGTSGWSYADWVGGFYPAGTKPGEYLGVYTGSFDIVEVDSTYYRVPALRTVQGWAAKTPESFRFAVKAPDTITHEKCLLNCRADVEEFLTALEPLDDKLCAILLQFGYFNKQAFAAPAKFFDRLDAFLGVLPDPRRVAVEIRNRTWFNDAFLGVLRGHGASVALADHVWMPPIERLLDTLDCLTGDFLYVRLIGDRKGIEAITTTWDEVVVDRSERIRSIVKALAGVLPRADIIAFINNHYAGHAPASCRMFLEAMASAGVSPSPRRARASAPKRRRNRESAS